jgi:tRNA(fMet)-specific endonuclease VapC
MIEYLLDTNIVSDFVQRPLGPARQRADRIGFERLATSVIVAGELKFGYIRRESARLKRDVEAVLGSLPVLALEAPADWHYASVRAELERRGMPIGSNDMLIAAHALALDCTLVTANEREFRRVPGLRVENWLA